MDTFIIRKPKFMRSDLGMEAYMTVADTISKEMSRPGLTTDQLYALSLKFVDCLDKAAKAGGFLNTNDFCKWIAKQKSTTTKVEL